MSTEVNNPVKHEMTCAVKTLNELFAESICIPCYQRPYSWEVKRVENLLKSIAEAARRPEARLLLGTIVIYRNATEQLEVVDGQQRLVTLQILCETATVPTCASLAQSLASGDSFKHTESQVNLSANRAKIEAWWKKQKLEVQESIRALLNERVDFIVVRAPTLDDAFIFFNSQNNRGKRLEEYDLLKANHLRRTADDLQKTCAESWERIERTGKEQVAKDCGTVPPTLGHLMTGILGLTRTSALNRKQSLLEEFRCQRASPQNPPGFYPLSNYIQPAMFDGWAYDSNTHAVRLTPETGNAAPRAPFQMTQSIEGGEQFFWFVEKYNAIYRDLFVTPVASLPLWFSELMASVRSADTGQHVRKFLEAVVVFYHDKFGVKNDAESKRAVLLLSFAIFDLKSRQVVRELSVPKCIRDTFNPFALIQEASMPSFMIQTIENGIEASKWYTRFSPKKPALTCRQVMSKFYTTHDEASGLASQMNP